MPGLIGLTRVIVQVERYRERIVMLIVGENINTSRKSIEEAVRKRDAAFITMIA